MAIAESPAASTRRPLELRPVPGDDSPMSRLSPVNYALALKALVDRAMDVSNWAQKPFQDMGSGIATREGAFSAEQIKTLEKILRTNGVFIPGTNIASSDTSLHLGSSIGQEERTIDRMMAAFQQALTPPEAALAVRQPVGMFRAIQSAPITAPASEFTGSGPAVGLFPKPTFRGA